MNLNSPSDIARELKAGTCPPAPPWLLAKAAQLIVDELTSAAMPLKLLEARNAVKALNGNCYFELSRTVAKGWLDVCGFDPTIQKRLVQALINTSLLDEAEALANHGIEGSLKLVSDATAAAELGEYRGLLGRISKQRFVSSGDRNALIAATDRYYAEYLKDSKSNYWHGINALACLTLEHEGGPVRPTTPAPEELAEQVLATTSKSYLAKPDSWLAATASEASLALGHCDNAELWLYRFLTRADTLPFNIDSYSRQLREIWGGNPLSGTSCADRLAGIIARFIAKTQARVTLSPSEVPAMKAALEDDHRGLEKNFLGESSFSVESIRSLLKAFESIGCVMNDIGERLGTGFLLRGSRLKSGFGDELVFVTNAHVISEQVVNAIPSSKARVTFELESTTGGQRPQYAVKEVLFTSVPGKIGVANSTGDELDCTIVRLEGLPASAAPLRSTVDLPLISPLTKAFVAGHPRGAGLQIALHDSVLLDIDQDERLMHYRTPTDPGSSGSPVFNADWEVMALHHAGTSTTPRLHGGGTYEANEGISIGAIRRKLNL